MSKSCKVVVLKLLLEECCWLIVEQVEVQGWVIVEELVQCFGIFVVIICVDLEVFDCVGVFICLYGGVVLVVFLQQDILLIIKEICYYLQKWCIGEVVVKLVQDGEIIIIDLGFIMVEIVCVLWQCCWNELMVIINVLNIVLELSGLSGVWVMMFGGMLCFMFYLLVGFDVEQVLLWLFVDCLFFGVDGLDLVIGVIMFDLLEVLFNVLMV